MVRQQLAGALCSLLVCLAAHAQTRDMNIPGGDLKTALDTYAAQSGLQLLYNAAEVKGITTKGAHGAMTQEQALAALLADSGMVVKRDGASALVIFRGTLLDLPAQDAAEAIAALSAKTGLRIVVPAEAKGLRSSALKGSYEPRDALRRLIEGSGLEIVSDDGITIVLRKQPEMALATVTVTAQKRSQSAQTVPISMTTFSAKALEVNRVQNLQDVAALTPGLLVSAFSQNSPTIAIRGINNTFSQIGVSKPVAVVVDDVFIPRNSAASFELFDLDSIAVLKGPQGTLFGRNVTGGAIVMTTRPPSLDERIVETELTAGSLGDRQFNTLLSQPLGENAAFKLTTALHDRNGYGVDRLTGKEQDDINSRNYRAQLLVKLGSSAEATFSADYAEDWNGGRTLSSDTLGNDGNVRTSELGVDQGFTRTISGSSAKFSWKLDAGELTSITAYRKSHSSEDYSGVGANYSFLASGSQSVVRDADQIGTFSQELRYASPKWSFGDFVTGIYYMREDGSRQLATRGLAAKTGALASSILASQNVDTTSYAAFADGTLHLPAAFDLTAGIRYTRDEKTAALARYDLVKPTNNFSASDVKASWGELTPRIVLSWEPQSNVMAYTSVTRGFTAGGFNGDASSLAVFKTPFSPEKVTNYEAGVKTQWLQNRLRVNASVYKMEYKDKQELVNNSLTGVLTIVNASKATVKGGELEVAYKPVNWLDLSASYSKIDGTYDSFVVGAVNNSGNPVASAPRNQYSAAANMTVPLASTGYVVGAASYSWRDTYNTGAANDPNLQIPAYGLTNLSLGYESADRGWRLVAWVKNASDTKYILTRSTQVVRAEYVGEPRTYGVTLSSKF
ncbi:TonB-dependent receptor domain-containing protein [Undibacterium sp.]|uniref:TonB-dependent receptor domain-containing protein n=1 Tax=Undibacterium sp. TaxID=1914977 RepID=UPI00374DA0CA